MTLVDCPDEGCDRRVREPLLFDHLVERHGATYEEAHEAVAVHPSASFLSPPPVSEFDGDRLVRMYRRMRLIRDFEESVIRLGDEGEVPGSAHPCVGQEGVAVGVCEALGEDDLITSTHRGHGHLLARGLDPAAMLAEIGGRRGGTNGGKGGTMHMVDLGLGNIGQNAIVGANAPQMTGAVLQERLSGGEAVGVAFFGEGAMNQGAAAEAMNLAAIWDLPVLFVCENNRYEVTLAWKEAIATEYLPARAEGLGVPGTTVDGQDVRRVYTAAREAVERARDGGGPYFIECQTYRFCGHFAAEDRFAGLEYRPEGEREYWEAYRDPIASLAGAMEAAGVLSADEREAIDDEVADEVAEVEAYLRASDYPAAEDALTDVYANQDYEHFPAPGYR